MNILEKKQEIKSEIDRIEDEKLLWAVARLLQIEEEEDIPEWHKQILEERIKKHGSGQLKMKNWEEVKKRL
jgi:hypothetical protein